MLYDLHMKRVLLLGFVVAATACGNSNDKTFPSLCANQVSPPVGCATACDPSPTAANSCLGGLHCSADGKCDTVCTAMGGQCGNEYFCTSDGRCVPNGSGSGDMPDACPSVHFTAMKTTPSIELLIDKSGSMAQDFDGGSGTPAKFPTERDALVGTMGIVTKLQGSVYFGAAMYPSDVCPGVFSTPRKLNNLTPIANLIDAHGPSGHTPTAEAINAVVADFMANPPPKGSPPVILLSTDGLPNTCSDPDATVQGEMDTIVSAKNAFSKGIRLFLLVVGNQIDSQFAKDLANAGQGIVAGQPDAIPYKATDPTSLSAAFQTIISGVLSCDLQLSGQVDPMAGKNGTVTLNNTTLTYSTDWTLDANGLTLHLLGDACTMLKNSQNPVVDATFSCGVVIQ